MTRPSLMNRPMVMVMFAALGIFAYVSIAQKEPKVAEEVLARPSAIPDRVILTWAGDPATSQAVNWRTAANGAKGVAQISTATDGPQFAKSAATVNAQTEILKTDLNEAAYHSVDFTQLKPDTLYTYRVGDGFNWSEWNQFRTASDKPAPLEFLYVGDAQVDIFSMWSRLVRMGYSDAPKSRFIVHAGDLVNKGSRDAEWGEWHQAAGWINRSMVSFPSAGNHEYDTKKLTKHWRAQFRLPENGVAGVEESCYFIDVQGVRMISLNSNEKQKEQAEWLDALLEKNSQKWTVIAFHHPIYSAAKARDNKETRELWQPIFDKHRVDLVLTGHDHTYARSNLRTGLNMKNAGTVYVVSVSGPKMYKLEKEPWMQSSAENTQLYQVVRIDGDKLRYEARTARGTLYDSFELSKQKGKPNKIVNGSQKAD